MYEKNARSYIRKKKMIIDNEDDLKKFSEMLLNYYNYITI